MPSNLHEFLILLFRNRSTSAADLLRELHIKLPKYSEVRIEAADIGNLDPAEFRADLVLFFERRARKKLGVIIEVQLGRDVSKEYAWPAYVANLRARHRCPVCLLVITIDEEIARWAGKTLEIGPGIEFTPWVINPSNLPSVTESQQATENVDLAMLSAIVHGKGVDRVLADRVISTAVDALDAIDAERGTLYFDFLKLFVGQSAPEIFEESMKNSVECKYKSEFVRHHFFEGAAAGELLGRRELMIKLLQRRFKSVSDAVQARVRAAQDSQLEALIEQIFTAQSPEQALDALG